MGGNDVPHYVQYDNDIFILSSSKEINRFQTNSYTTGKVGCSKDKIKAIFREHISKKGEGGIRTRGGVTPAQSFQDCTIGHSDTSPYNLIYHKIFFF